MSESQPAITDRLGTPLHGVSHDIGGLDGVAVVPLWGTITWDPAKPIPDRFHRADGTFGTLNLAAVEMAGTYLITRVV